MRETKSTSTSRFKPTPTLIGLIVIITLIALPILTYPLGRDQGVFATIGRGLLNGKILYVDLWDIKPPAVFYVYALAIKLFGTTAAAVRVIDLALFPPTAAALWWIGRRVASARVGLWAALLFGVFYFTETFWTLTQNDGIALLPMVLAVVCAFKAADGGRRSVGWALIAGGLSAYAIWFKYPFVIFVGVVVFAYLWMQSVNAPTKTRRRIIVDGIGFAAGGLLIGAVGAALLLAVGAWAALIETALTTTEYAAHGAAVSLDAVQTALGFRWQHWGLLFLLAGIAGLVTIRHLAIRHFSRRSRWWLVLVWLIGGAAILIVQAKGFDYHWLPLLPPLALIAAGGIEAVLEFVPSPPAPLPRKRGEGRQAIPPANVSPSLKSPLPGSGRGDLGVRGILRGLFALVLLIAMIVVIWRPALPYLTGREDQIAYDHHFQAGEFVADESQQVADFLRQRVAPGDSLFIWGARPEVYYLSQLNPAVRFLVQFPLVADWYPPEWRQQTVDILWAALPPYVLVLQGDYLPWITGLDEDSNTMLQDYTELNNWLEFNYERDSQIGNFLIWRRTSKSK